MIDKNKISDFFYLEAEAAKKSWEALMALPVKERIRKRKTIKDVYLDRNFREYSDENYVLLRVSIGVNLSDFKEGECLILHKEGTSSGIKSTLNSFEGDDSIILEVFPPNLPTELESYYDEPLLLDKDLVDLREHVFYKFLAELKFEPEYWENMLVNNPTVPKMVDKDKCAEEVDETCDSFQISLLANQREAIINSLAAKDYYLIQGPPGTGKSFVLAWIIIEEAYVYNHKVAVIGPNHMAINNALLQVRKQLPDSPVCKVGQSYNAPKTPINRDGEESKIPREIITSNISKSISCFVILPNDGVQ